MLTSPKSWVHTGMPINRVLENPAMATNTPHRSWGRRRSVATVAETSTVRMTDATPAAIMPAAWTMPSRSRLSSRPTTQLQGTAILTIYLLTKLFSRWVIQPKRPIR